MELISEPVNAYAAAFTSEEDTLLHKIADFTYRTHSQAQMLSGHVQGKLLEQISHMIQPKRILEIGTFVGYSALCLAKGLQTDGVLHTIEINKEDAKTAKGFFDESNLGKKIALHVGDALTIIESLNETWDLVFIDADKVNYIRYFEAVLPSLRKGGIILADNVLFHGEVLNTPITGKNAIAIQAFNEHIQKDDRVEKVMLTVRDGLFLIRKK